MFIWCTPVHTIWQTVALPVIWHAMTSMWRHRNNTQRIRNTVDWGTRLSRWISGFFIYGITTAKYLLKMSIWARNVGPWYFLCCQFEKAINNSRVAGDFRRHDAYMTLLWLLIKITPTYNWGPNKMAAIWQTTFSNTWWQCLNFAQNSTHMYCTGSIDDPAALVRVMAWFTQTPSHNLYQWWPNSLILYSVIRPQWVNSSCQDMGSYSSNFAKFGFFTFSQVDKSHNNNVSSGYSHSCCHLLWCSWVVGDGINSLQLEIRISCHT